jgi:predicted dinucleotide-binding enzyme
MTTIGFIGAGNIGGQLARKAIENGYDVVISNSRGPETLSALIDELGPRARAATPAEAGEAGDIVVVTVPFKNFTAVPVEPLAGKIVIDTNNYYFERDGHFPELDNGTATVSGMLQAHLPRSRVVKGFNHITAADITADSHPAGAPDRRALGVASDFADAAESLTKLYDEFGFDAVNAGTLAESWRFERDRPAYVVRHNAAELTANLAIAPRTV